MAQNEMVTDIVADKAYEQVARLTKDIKEGTEAMVAFSKAGKSAFEMLGNSKNLVDFTNAAKASSEANKGALDRLEDYKKAVKDTDAFMNQFSNTMKENIKLFVAQQSQMDQIKKELKEARQLYGENSAQVHKLTDEQLRLKATMAETRIALTAENKERIAAAGSIDELAQRLGRLKDTYRALGDVERNSEGGLKLVEQIQTMDAELKKANASIGNFQGNVGNYPTVAAELKDITNKLIALKIAGKENSDEFRDLSAKAQGLQSAMGGVNRELKEAGKQSQSFMDRLKEMGKNLLAAATAYLSFQTVKQVFTDSIEEISQADEAAGRLKNTLEGLGNVGAFNRFAAQAEEFADKLKYLDNDDLNEVFNKLLTYGKLTEDQMSDLLPVIIDFAAKEKVSVVDASETIIKALEGNGKALKTYGIDIKDAADATETAASPTERLSLIMKELKPRVDGAAEAFGNTLPGKMAILKQGIADLEEEFGRFLEKLSGVEEQQHRNAVAAKNEASEGQKLIAEYETLNKKVGQTSEEKKRLSDITNQLVGIFGNSVVSIDEETGALKLNLEATKDLITQKLLLADAEAAKLANAYNKQKTALDALNVELEKATKLKEQYSQTPGADRLVDQQVKNIAQDKARIEGLKKEIAKTLKELADLNFSEADVNKLFNPNAPIVPKAGGDKSEAKPVKDNRLKIEQEFTAQSYALIQQRIKALQFEQQTIIDSDASAYQERLAAQAEFNELQKLADKKANEAQLQEIQNSLDEIERIKKISEGKRTQEQKDLLAREKTILLKLVEADGNYEATKLESAKRNKEAILAIDKDEADKRLALITDLNDSFDQQEMVAQLQLKDQYDKGLINFETYTKGKKKIEDQFQLARLMAEKAYLEAEMSATRAINPDADVSKYIIAIKNIDAAIGKVQLGATETKDTLGAVLQVASQAIETMKGALDAYYESQLAHQQSVLDGIETQKNAQLDAIDKSMMSDKKKEEARRSLLAQTAAQEKAIEQETRRIKRQQAIADRAAAILQVIEQTAIAYTAQLKIPVIGTALAIAVAALGAAQVATILATPLPAYAKGTPKDAVGHPGGPALVGEEYKRELVMEPGKDPYFVSQPTILPDLARGARVIPEVDLIAAQMGFMTPSLLQGITVQNEYKVLEQAMKDTASRVENAIAKIPIQNFSLNNGDWTKSISIGSTKTTFVNKHFH